VAWAGHVKDFLFQVPFDSIPSLVRLQGPLRRYLSNSALRTQDGVFGQPIRMTSPNIGNVVNVNISICDMAQIDSLIYPGDAKV